MVRLMGIFVTIRRRGLGLVMVGCLLVLFSLVGLPKSDAQETVPSVECPPGSGIFLPPSDCQPSSTHVPPSLKQPARTLQPARKPTQPPSATATAPSKPSAPAVPAEQVAPTKKEAEESRVELDHAPAPPIRSPIEQAFLPVKASLEVSRDLWQYGYDIFREPASTFAPVADVPVGPDYIVGPGDVLQAYMWGMVDNVFSLPVNRKGEIFLPKVGALPVWGMPFVQVQDLIKTQLAKYFSGFRLSLTMSELRSIQVFVVGEVMRPGVYTISSLSTVTNALFAAGGPSKLGSLRNIQLRRNNHIMGTIDLYDFLQRGDRTNDFRLESGDTVFVPPIGSVVGITGNVKRPAIYEVKEPLTLGELVEMAGGVTVLGYLQRIQVERIQDRERKVVMDLEFKDPSDFQQSSREVKLHDGDLVIVFQVDPSRYKFVTIKGNVRRPGDYELKPKMTLKDLVAKAEGILEGTHLERAEVSRFKDDRTREIIPVDLRKLFNGDASANLTLQQWDVVTIYHLSEVIPPKFVDISGAVYKPGQYELTPNMRLSDLIFRGGGLKLTASLKNAELYRIAADGQPQLVPIDLSNILNGRGKAGNDLLLKEGDHFFIKEDEREKNLVTLSGEVRYPGVYAITRGERLSSVLKRAGGFTQEAYLKGAVFIRERVKQQQQQELEKFIKSFEETLLRESAALTEGSLQLTSQSKEEATLAQQTLVQKRELLQLLSSKVVLGRMVIKLDDLEKLEGSPSDIVLEGGDMLTVPKKPYAVLVLGSVRNPSAVLHEEGKDVGYYLNRVGGLAKDADKKEIHVVKADGSAVAGFLKLRNIEPGDIIVVPPETEPRVRTLPTLKDIATIVGQFALTVGVLGALL